MGVIGYCGYRVVLTVKVRAFTVYLNEGSTEAALLAAGAVVDLTERVVRCVASVRASATAIPVRAWMGVVSRPLLLTFANERTAVAFGCCASAAERRTNGRRCRGLRVARCICMFYVACCMRSGEVTNGVAVVRPPGHHAEPGACMGFCLFGNPAHPPPPPSLPLPGPSTPPLLHSSPFLTIPAQPHSLHARAHQVAFRQPIP
jgi:hypothetical protein